MHVHTCTHARMHTDRQTQTQTYRHTQTHIQIPYTYICTYIHTNNSQHFAHLKFVAENLQMIRRKSWVGSQHGRPTHLTGCRRHGTHQYICLYKVYICVRTDIHTYVPARTRKLVWFPLGHLLSMVTKSVCEVLRTDSPLTSRSISPICTHRHRQTEQTERQSWSGSMGVHTN